MKGDARWMPGEGTPFAEVPFLVVDVETTGMSAWAGDRVTEVAALVVQRGVVAEAFHSLVNPQQPIPPHITRLTGITNAMVRRAPRFRDIAGDLAQHVAGRVFVAHNAHFDWNFLAAEYGRLARRRADRFMLSPLDALATARLCTVRLARRFLAHLPRRNLDAVAWHYGVAIEGRHRARGDARATALVLLGLLRDAERGGVHTWEALDEFLSRRTARWRRARRALPGPSDARDGA